MKTDFLRETSAFLSCDPFARRHAKIFSDMPEQHALTPCTGKRQNPFWAADAGETIWYFLICTFLQSCYNKSYKLKVKREQDQGNVRYGQGYDAVIQQAVCRAP